MLAEHGADVVLAGRRPDPLESTAKEVRRWAAARWRYPPTSPSAEACRHWSTRLCRVRQARCPGQLCRRGADQVDLKWPDDDFDNVLALNFKAVWHLSKAAAKPMMAQGKGAIVNISSGASLLAMPQAAPYGAAKAAVNNLTGSMAAAWAKKAFESTPLRSARCGPQP